MQASEYICRKATSFDNTKSIAKYIHLTDPYIYPSICENPIDEKWVAFISECLKTKDNLFNINNLSVVLFKEDIVGIACVVSCGNELNFSERIADKKTPNKINTAIAEYFDPLINECNQFRGYNIINFCIDPMHQGKGVGTLLMSHCMGEYGSSTIHLDVVASNDTAIHLYKKFGFVIESEYLGFSGNGTDLPCYHMVYVNNN